MSESIIGLLPGVVVTVVISSARLVVVRGGISVVVVPEKVVNGHTVGTLDHHENIIILKRRGDFVLYNFDVRMVTTWTEATLHWTFFWCVVVQTTRIFGEK